MSRILVTGAGGFLGAAVADLGAKLRNHLLMPAELFESNTNDAKVVAK